MWGKVARVRKRSLLHHKNLKWKLKKPEMDGNERECRMAAFTHAYTRPFPIVAFYLM